MNLFAVAILGFGGVLCQAEDFRSAAVAQSRLVGLDFSHQPIPVFQGGYLIARSASRTGFSIWDRDGKLTNRQEVSHPGATETVLIDAAIAPDGAVALVASGLDNQRRLASAIAWASTTGPVTRVVATGAFAPRRIVFAADGSLWAFGREEAVDYDTLRHYDREGKFIGGALRRATFRHPGKASPSTDSHLVLNGDRLGVLSLTASEWIELSGTGEVVGRWPVRLAPGSGITGAAMIGRNLVVSVAASETFDLRRFNRNTGELIPIDTAAVQNASQGLLVLGSEGDRVVARVKPPWKLVWLTLQ